MLASEAWRARQYELEAGWALAEGAKRWTDLAVMGQVLPLTKLRAFGLEVGRLTRPLPPYPPLPHTPPTNHHMLAFRTFDLSGSYF